MAKKRYCLSILLLLSIHVGANAQQLSLKREKVVKTYNSLIGVRELTGHNDGPMVERILRYCGLPKGQAWCAATVCYTFGQAGVVNPRSGYCPDLFRGNVVYYHRNHDPNLMPRPGDVFGLYFPEKGRVAHVGFIDHIEGSYVITVEGNTNEAGSREGDGVYRKRRPISSIYIAANYIPDQ